jgi:ribosomal protein L37AE/L43A
MFERRRTQRAFNERIDEEIARTAPAIERICTEARAELDAVAREVAAVPGAAARCQSCGGRMALKRVKRKRKWWTLWVCSACGATARPADLPQEVRAAGWA